MIPRSKRTCLLLTSLGSASLIPCQSWGAVTVIPNVLAQAVVENSSPDTTVTFKVTNTFTAAVTIDDLVGPKAVRSIEGDLDDVVVVAQDLVNSTCKKNFVLAANGGSCIIVIKIEAFDQDARIDPKSNDNDRNTLTIAEGVLLKANAILKGKPNPVIGKTVVQVLDPGVAPKFPPQ